MAWQLLEEAHMSSACKHREGLEFLCPHRCGASVRQAVANVRTSVPCLWKTYVTCFQMWVLCMHGWISLCTWKLQCCLICPLILYRDERQSYCTLVFFLPSHELNSPLLPPVRILCIPILCVYTFLLFYSWFLLVQLLLSFFLLPLIFLKAESRISMMYTNCVKLWPPPL